jgi:two-component system sensor histidine kinase KdpD
VAVATGIGELLDRVAGSTGTDLLYLLPVLAISTLYGFRQGMVTSIASALAYNFFFTAPLHSFQISDADSILTVVILLLVSLVTSRLAARLRAVAGAAEARADYNEALAGFANQLLASRSPAEVAAVTAREVGRLLHVNALLVDARDDRLMVVAGTPHSVQLSEMDGLAARIAVESRQRAGRWTSQHAASDWTFHPLAVGGEARVALGLARDDGLVPVNAADEALLGSLLGQAALALERLRLQAELANFAQLEERDRLRAALLSSVGHDLRTPLTAIAAAASELRQGARVRPDLAATITAEASRLDRYIANLLDMTRIEAGALCLKVEAVDLEEAVASAVEDVAPGIGGFKTERRYSSNLPLVLADPQLLHHCLINLLDNAGRHGRSAGTVTVSAIADRDSLVLSIADEGPGIPQDAETEVFGRFVRLDGSDRAGGTGLGLAIVKGFSEAMGLSVQAGNRKDRQGAVFTITFPPATVIALAAAEA